jgi:flagellar hook-length control protein FliK
MREFPLISRPEASRGAAASSGGKPAPDIATAPFAAVLDDRMTRAKPLAATTAKAPEATSGMPDKQSARAMPRTEGAESDSAAAHAMEDSAAADAASESEESVLPTAALVASLTVALVGQSKIPQEQDPVAAEKGIAPDEMAAEDFDPIQNPNAAPLEAIDASALAAANVVAAPIHMPSHALAVASAQSPVLAVAANTIAESAASVDGRVGSSTNSDGTAGVAPMAIAAETLAASPASADAAAAGKDDRGQGEFAQLLAHSQREGGIGAQVSHQASVQRAEQSIVLQHPAGESRWQNELGDKLVWMAGAQRQQAELVLNPPQLGRVEVSLTVTGDQANAVFASPNAAVREMLENSLPRLREIMSGAGIQLGDAQINSGNPQQGNGSQDAPRNAFRPLLSEAESTASRLAESPRARILTGRGLVDTFV